MARERVTITLGLDVETHKKLRELADEKDMPLTALIRLYIKAGMKAEELI